MDGIPRVLLQGTMKKDFGNAQSPIDGKQVSIKGLKAKVVLIAATKKFGLDSMI